MKLDRPNGIPYNKGKGGLAAMPPQGREPLMWTGMTSITFRNLSPATIAALAAQAGLDGIEWGGDIHVPAGDADAARTVRTLTADQGLRVLSYGSYNHGESVASITPVLESALTLGAPIVRVWAGERGSAQMDAAARGQLAETLHGQAELAAQAGLVLAMEYHPNTMTDTIQSATWLLDQVNLPNFRCYWQQNPLLAQVEHLREIAALGDRLAQVHVFACMADDTILPLEAHAPRWREYFAAIRRAGGERALILEHVREHDTAQFLRDAALLHELLASARA